MKWGGAYAKHAISQFKACNRMTPTLLNISETLPSGSKFIEYGVADGVNSIPYISKLASMKKFDLFYFNDIPSNDWNTLNSSVQSALPKTVSYFLVPSSFYDQVIPGSSLDLGFSSIAMHWLPYDVDYPKAKTLIMQDKRNLSKHEAEIFSEIGHEALLKNLRNRAKELTHGGYFLFNLSGTTLIDGKYIYTYKAFFETVADIYKDLNMELPKPFPIYLRSKQEIMQVLNCIPELNLISFETYSLNSPYALDSTFTEEYIHSIKAWCPLLPERVFDELIKRVEQDPMLFIENDYVVHEILLRKG